MIDINDITEETKDLLESYEYARGLYYETNKISSVIDEWYKNKKNLISLFENHPNYNGRGQIVLTEEYARRIDYAQIVRMATKFFQKLTDELGSIDTENNAEERKNYVYALRLMSIVKMAADDKKINAVVDDSFMEYVGRENDTEFQADIHMGEKLSRKIRKYLTKTNICNSSDFERDYAKLSDALNPLKVQRYTILSVHPIDYYTMSFGNTWSSCHTIDKTNSRGCDDDGYQGCYSAGTESYMLDEVSVVMYTIDSKSDISKPELCDKISRQMLHVGDEFFIQARLYPQCNDGDSWEYKQMREIAQRVIAECKKIPNYWRNKKGTSEVRKVVEQSMGPHYRDYFSFDSCNVSYTLKENFKKITIGHSAICPCCGYWHDRQNNIMCRDCSNERVCDRCGEDINNDDYYATADGHVYCCYECMESDGYVYCDNEDAYYSESDPDVFYDRNYEEFYYDADGTSIEIDGYRFIDEDSAFEYGYRYVESEDNWYFSDDVHLCSECGEYVLNQDYDEDHDMCIKCYNASKE